MNFPDTKFLLCRFIIFINIAKICSFFINLESGSFVFPMMFFNVSVALFVHSYLSLGFCLSGWPVSNGYIHVGMRFRDLFTMVEFFCPTHFHYSGTITYILSSQGSLKENWMAFKPVFSPSRQLIYGHLL